MGNVSWKFSKIADVCNPETPPLKIADILCGRPQGEKLVNFAKKTLQTDHIHLQNLELCLGKCFPWFFADILNLFVAVRQLWHQFKSGKLILNEYYETRFKQHYNRAINILTLHYIFEFMKKYKLIEFLTKLWRKTI